MYNRFVALDFETASYERTSACALGIAVVENLQITAQTCFLIKPPSRHFVFSYLHGITWDDVKNKPSFDELWPEIQEYFIDIDFIAAHNASFDKSVMKACCSYYGIEPPAHEYRCTCRLSRKMLNLENNRLDTVSRYFGIELKHHDAMSDTLACAGIMINLCR